jgi:hypothetical protein
MRPDHHRCAYVTSHGIRCGGLATWSDDTHGAGPWYCRYHRKRSGAYADQVAEDTSRHGFQAEPDWHDELCQERIRTFDLPPDMNYEDVLDVLTGTVFGDLLMKHLARARSERERMRAAFNQNERP